MSIASLIKDAVAKEMIADSLTIAYHLSAAPSAMILDHGIESGRDGLVHLYAKLAGAIAARSLFPDGTETLQIWRVDVSGLVLDIDPKTEAICESVADSDDDEICHHGYTFGGAIPADRVLSLLPY